MESGSLHLNGVSWKYFPLSNSVLLLTLTNADDKRLSHCRSLARSVSSITSGIREVVPAYDSVAIFFDPSVFSHSTLIAGIETSGDQTITEEISRKHVIPVCYDLGVDLERVEQHTGRTRSQLISAHSGMEYEVAMLGFLPGFIFLDGLLPELSCERLDEPRKSVPAGSVGIGGSQTGIYSLSTPGGWNVIGRTPLNLFDPKRNPPVTIKAGDRIVFKKISIAEFETYPSGEEKGGSNEYVG